MTKTQFLALFEDVLEADPETVKGDELLIDLDGWNSLKVMEFIAMVDENFEIILSPPKIADAKTVKDLIALLGDKITG